MQDTVANEPSQVYEGKVQSGPNTTQIFSRLASALIFFGKLVCPLADDDLAVGGAGEGQSCKPPASIADALLAKHGGGIAIADPSLERLRVSGGDANSAPYGAYLDEASVSIMRKGQIWVVVETALLDLSLPVFVRIANAGGSPPVEALGSFSPVNGGDLEPAPDGLAWLGSALEGGIDYALLDVNLPG